MHYKKESLEVLLNTLSDLNNLYIERSFSLDNQLIQFLVESEKFYEQTGDVANKSEVATLTLYFDTAIKGFNPQTLEKLKINKRNNIWISAYHVLTELGKLLRHSIGEVEEHIQKVSAQLDQLVLSLIQSNVIDDNFLEKLRDYNEIGTLWEQLMQNEQIKLLDRKLKLSILQDDIFIILDKIFSKISPYSQKE